MNLSHNKKAATPVALVPRSDSPLIADQPELELPLCEKFGSWLDERLAALEAELNAFVTRDSLRRNLRRR